MDSEVVLTGATGALSVRLLSEVVVVVRTADTSSSSLAQEGNPTMAARDMMRRVIFFIMWCWSSLHSDWGILLRASEWVFFRMGNKCQPPRL